MHQDAIMINKLTTSLFLILGFITLSNANTKPQLSTNVESTICSIATQQQVTPFLVALYLHTPESIEWIKKQSEARDWLVNFCGRQGLKELNWGLRYQYINNTKIDAEWILNTQIKAYNLGNFKLENFLQSITGYHIAHHPGELSGWLW